MNTVTTVRFQHIAPVTGTARNKGLMLAEHDPYAAENMNIAPDDPPIVVRK